MVAREDPRTDDVRALLEAHLAFAQSYTPPQHIHALDIEGLLDLALTLYGLREDGRLIAIGALKEIDRGHGEIKSMHTAAVARGRGVGRAMLDHLLSVARERGYARVSLETGSMPAFAPARSLYAGAGFQPCGPFAGYPPSSSNLFMTLAL